MRVVDVWDSIPDYGTAARCPRGFILHSIYPFTDGDASGAAWRKYGVVGARDRDSRILLYSAGSGRSDLLFVDGTAGAAERNIVFLLSAPVERTGSAAALHEIADLRVCLSQRLFRRKKDDAVVFGFRLLSETGTLHRENVLFQQ